LQYIFEEVVVEALADRIEGWVDVEPNISLRNLLFEQIFVFEQPPALSINPDRSGSHENFCGRH
jgi:hypothetical protein